MMHEKGDDLDRRLDAELHALVRGEPRRTSAASVRRAIDAPRSSKTPMWLAVAAVIVVVTGVFDYRQRTTDRSIQSSGTPPQKASIASKEPPTLASASSPASLRVGVAINPSKNFPAEEPFEGLPRLVIAPIDAPEWLTPGRLGIDSNPIQPIEIAPLSISNLSDERDKSNQP